MKLAAKVLLVLALMAATAAVTFCVTVSEYDSAQAEESPAAAKVEEIRRYLAS